MKEKQCLKCRVTQPIENFYKHKKMLDGYTTRCKECTKAQVRNYYQNNREKVAAFDRKRNQNSKRKEQRLEHQRHRRAKFPEKEKARRAISYALRTNKITRLPCEVCGDEKTQGHHEDYSKPLDVNWLCFKHHRERHGQTVN